MSQTVEEANYLYFFDNIAQKTVPFMRTLVRRNKKWVV